MITLKDVTYFYPNHSVPSIKNVNLNIQKGEFIVLTGKSGCGKTTITRVVNGLATKFYEGSLEGIVKIDGQNVNEMPLWALGKNIGSIFQDPKSQFFASLVEDEVAFGCENYGVNADEIDLKVLTSLNKVNGDKLIGKELFNLSSGEKQKVSIASINALNPDIYVFDEPSANLDMYSVEKLKSLLYDLKKQGKTILISEHRLYYLKDLADRYLYLEKGLLKEEWSKEEIYKISKDKWEKLGLRTLSFKNSIAVEKNKTDKELNNRLWIQLNNLEFRYKNNRIFNKLNLTLYGGEIVAITGGNGMGKTTVAKILCGILKEQGGKVEYLGKPLNHRNRKNKLYFVSQNTECQLFGESVKEELMLNDVEVKAERVLAKYGLSGVLDRHPSTLSGGQKQRLTLAVSDVINRDVLIYDEPTSGVDGKNMFLISSRLKELASKGKIILVITHDYEFIVKTCEKVVLLSKKQKITSLSVEDNSQELLRIMSGYKEDNQYA